MIMMGPKKDKGSIVASILEKKHHGDMKYTGEDYKKHENKEEDSQELDHLASKVISAVQSGDASALKNALKDFIKQC